jgi:hypothetical protein
MSCDGSFGADEMWSSRGDVCAIVVLIMRVVARVGRNDGLLLPKIKLAGPSTYMTSRGYYILQ